MRSTRSTSFVFLALACAASIPARASADVSVIVLGVRSLEGDDEFSRNLTGALRHAASSVDGWSVTNREVTLSQMALAHGCDDPHPDCLTEMAATLQVQRIIYGDVRRTSAGHDFNFAVSIQIFNAETHEIEHTVTDTVNGHRIDIDDLREPVRRYLGELVGAPRTGTLRISVNVPGAEVFVDEASAGVADARGRLTVENVDAGTRNIRITALGHHGFRSTVSVTAYGESAFEAELEAGNDPSGGGGVDLDLIVGGGLLVVGAGFAVAWIATMAELAFDLNQNASWHTYRNAYYDWLHPTTGMPPTDSWNADPCAAANAGADFSSPNVSAQVRQTSQSVCNSGSTLEVLQYVFLGAGVLTAGIGAYFLVSALTRGGSRPPSNAFMLMPSVSSDRAYLAARWAF